jgi:hypothetical protein
MFRPGVKATARVSFELPAADSGTDSFVVVIVLPCGWKLPIRPVINVNASSVSLSYPPQPTLQLLVGGGADEPRFDERTHTLNFTLRGWDKDVDAASIGTPKLGFDLLEATPPRAASSGTEVAETTDSWVSVLDDGAVVHGPTLLEFPTVAATSFVVEWDPGAGPPARLISHSSLPLIRVRVHDDAIEGRVGLLQTGDGTEYDAVFCELVVSGVRMGSSSSASSESSAILGGRHLSPLVNGTASFSSDGGVFTAPALGAELDLRVDCSSEGRGASGEQLFVFTPATATVTATPFAATIEPSNLGSHFFSSGATAAGAHFVPAVRLGLYPADSTDVGVTLSENITSTMCVVSVAVVGHGGAFHDDGYSASLLAQTSAFMETSEPGASLATAVFDRLLVSAGGSEPSPPPAPASLPTASATDLTTSLFANGSSMDSVTLPLPSIAPYSSLVSFGFECFWAGDRRFPLPFQTSASPSSSSPAVAISSDGTTASFNSTSHLLRASWLYPPPTSIDQGRDLGACDPETEEEEDCTESLAYMTVLITSQSGVRHLGRPYARCTLSVWSAAVLDAGEKQSVLTDGMYSADDEDKLPVLYGVVEAEAKAGKAVFSPLRIDWNNAVELVLRATCYTPHQHWVLPLLAEGDGTGSDGLLLSPTMAVGTVALEWATPPPPLILFGSATTKKNKGFVHTERQVINNLTKKFKYVTTNTPLAVRMIQNTSSGELRSYNASKDSIKCTVAVATSFAPYDPHATVSDDETANGWEVVQGGTASVVLDVATFPALVIGKSPSYNASADEEGCVDFRIQCGFTDSAVTIPLLYWGQEDSAHPELKCRSQKQPLRIVLAHFPASADISAPTETDFVVIVEKQIWDEDAKGTDSGALVWAPMTGDDSSVCEASVDWAQVVASDTDTPRVIGQTGTGLAGRSKVAVTQGVARFYNLVFTKVDVASAASNATKFVEFQGVGDRLWVSFTCTGAEEIGPVLANVSISGCEKGQESSASRDRCLACAPTHVQPKSLKHLVHLASTEVVIEACQPCCGVDKSINTTSSASSSCTAVANSARTSCECPAMYLAVNDESRQKANMSWPRKCIPCPNGGECSSPGTTFESVRAKRGWWQDKHFFVSGNHGSKMQEDLSFLECEKAANGDTACNGGEYESAYGNGTGVGACTTNSTTCNGGCRPNHKGFMCAVCMDGYKKGLDNFCEMCPESVQSSLSGFYAVIGACFLIAGLVATTRTFFMNALHNAEARALGKFERMVVAAGIETLDEVKRFEREFSWEDFDLSGRIARKLKIFISFSQVVSSFTANFNSIAWPISWRNFTSYFAFVNLNPFSFRNLGCAVKITFPDVFFFSTAWPLALCMVMYACYRVALHFRRTPLQDVKYVYKFVIGVFFCTYPSVSNACFRMTKCLEFADGSHWLEADLSIRCDEDPVSGWAVHEVLILTTRVAMTYKTMARWAYFFIAVFPIGFPLASYLMLWWHRDSLFLKRFAIGQFVETDLGSARVKRCLPDDKYDLVFEEDGDLTTGIDISCMRPQIGSISEYVNYRGHFCTPNPALVVKLGYLFDSYEPEFWYWEVLEMIPRLFLTGLVVFIIPQVPNQMACGCLLSMLMILLIAKFQPFVVDEDDTLQLCCSVAIFAGTLHTPLHTNALHTALHTHTLHAHTLHTHTLHTHTLHTNALHTALHTHTLHAHTLHTHTLHTNALHTALHTDAPHTHTLPDHTLHTHTLPDHPLQAFSAVLCYVSRTPWRVATTWARANSLECS